MRAALRVKPPVLIGKAVARGQYVNEKVKRQCILLGELIAGKKKLGLISSACHADDHFLSIHSHGYSNSNSILLNSILILIQQQIFTLV